MGCIINNDNCNTHNSNSIFKKQTGGIKISYVYYNITGNLTGYGNETTILSFVETINTTLNYVPATLMLVAICIVLFLSLIQRGFEPAKVFAGTTFASMILAIILFPMNLIAGKTLIIFVVLFPLSLFVLWAWGGKTV